MDYGGTYPAYIGLIGTGELERRVEEARQLSVDCTICPRECLSRRIDDEPGDCGIGRLAVIASSGAHFGEEKILTGARGSGTIFFAGCNLRCQFCESYEFSRYRMGRKVTPEQLATVFLTLQDRGCHHLNLVNPSHVIYQIIEALVFAIDLGFRLPIVYNTAGYDSVAGLRLFDGIVDIYLTDLKWGDSTHGRSYSGIQQYWEIATDAIQEMHRQVGDLTTDGRIAQRGLLVRHLVLPEEVAGTSRVMRFLAEEISTDTWVNIMDQYHPAYHADRCPEINRAITRTEYDRAVDSALAAGIHRGVPFDAMSGRIQPEGMPVTARARQSDTAALKTR